MNKKDQKLAKNNKTTKCGEQIPTQFSWITPEEQKKKAEELNKITKKN